MNFDTLTGGEAITGAAIFSSTGFLPSSGILSLCFWNPGFLLSLFACVFYLLQQYDTYSSLFER